MKLILRYIRPYLKRVAAGMSIKLLGTIMDLLIPYILAYIIDTVTPTGNMKGVLLWGGLMIFCSAAALILNVLANRSAAIP